MRYVLLLKPHSNIRYRQSLQTLALTELRCCLRAWGVDAQPELCRMGGEPFVAFESPLLPEEAWRAIAGNAGCCFAAEEKNGALYPLDRSERPYYPEELPQLLKYKGKTNPDFTLTLLHCAKAASAFAQSLDPLTVLDPLCGKATTLFCALCEGHNAVGLDVDGKALREADRYFERSLETHRYKHQRTEGSLTGPKGHNGKCVAYALSDTPEHYKQGDKRSLKLIEGDLAYLSAYVPEASCHLVVSDLPYGVQHAPMGGGGLSSLDKLIGQAALKGARALRPGGAMAFSFNSYTLRRAQAVQAMESAGLTALDEAPFNGFAHWVEQAVDRDAVIACKRL